jgi:hypothetical protein
MAAYVGSYRQSQAPPAPETEGAIVVVTADGKGVPMRRPLEQRLHEELGRPLRKAASREGKTDHRRAKGGRKSRKQTAYVGAVYTMAPFPRTVEDVLDEVHRQEQKKVRPRPQNKRVWAEMTQILEGQVSEGPRRLFSHLMWEVVERNPGAAKPVVCLMDGQASLWVQRQSYFGRSVGILDLFHVMERLWDAAYCFHPESSKEAEQFVDRYLRMLLEGKVGYVIGVFRRFRKKCTSPKRKELDKVINYFDANRAYMRYDEYLAAGYPIGSGVVEGACRHVVKDRMELSGMRWEIEGAQAILGLRATYLNGEWDAFIAHRIDCEQKQLYGCQDRATTQMTLAG